MQTCEQQTFLTLKDISQLSAQVYPSSRQALPGSEEARKMTVGSGRQLSMLLNQSSPLGVFSRILLGSSHWTNSEEFSYVWDRLDTKFALSAFQLTPLGQSTEEQKHAEAYICATCGKPFVPHKTKRGRKKNCSTECFRKYQQQSHGHYVSQQTYPFFAAIAQVETSS